MRMKLVEIDHRQVTEGIVLHARRIAGLDVYCIEAGEEGRGRKLEQIPISKMVIDPDVVHSTKVRVTELKDAELAKRDDVIFIWASKGQEQENQIVIMNLCPGFRGYATYHIEGEAELVVEGYEAQGAAGRMGGAPVPVVLVKGPCKLHWSRTGRLYGSRPNWSAIFDGAKWEVMPQGEEKLKDFLR